MALSASERGGSIGERATTLDSSTHRKLESTNRKATIVIEHIIQASDVAHTVSLKMSCEGLTSYALFQIMYSIKDLTRRTCYSLRCNIGLSTRSGTRSCSKRCTMRGSRGDSRRIQPW